MKISIIIPVHNSSNTIVRCVESILNNNTLDCEVILIDDNSNDDSLFKCKMLSTKFKNVIFKKNSGIGVSAARNTGLDIVNGDIIGFCDSDDTYESSALEYVSSFFKNNPEIDILITGYNKVDGTKITTYRSNCSGEWSINKIKYHVIFDNDIMGSMWNKFFKVSVLRNFRFNNLLSHCEDMNFMMRIITFNSYKLKAYVSDYVTYNYFTNTDSLTQKVDRIFDLNGALKYKASFDDILSECKLDLYTTMLIKHKLFFIATDIMKCYKLNELQTKNINIIMKENFFPFILLTWKFPLKNIKRIVSILIFKLSNFFNRM